MNKWKPRSPDHLQQKALDDFYAHKDVCEECDDVFPEGELVYYEGRMVCIDCKDRLVVEDESLM